VTEMAPRINRVAVSSSHFGAGDMAAKAEAAFAKWDFVSAVFASQAAYRAAAAYPDLVRGLPPGTTELERGTKKTGAEACPSAKK
jgi:hypothetical protein